MIVTHGNGPQVGELATLESQSLAILTAQTQAWIGIEIENTISNALHLIGVKRDYMVPEVVLTRVLVNRSSAAFHNPSKPIGRFYGKKEAASLVRKGYTMKKLIDGYRRVVPSPEPEDILESGLIGQMLDDRKIVIACGGGGIPVFKTQEGLEYAQAVLDKDRTSSLLARKVRADRFLILTNVDGAYLDFRKKGQSLIRRIGTKEMEKHLAEGHFEGGSMKPKVEACVAFARHSRKPAVIGNMSRPENAIAQKGVTVVSDS